MVNLFGYTAGNVQRKDVCHTSMYTLIWCNEGISIIAFEHFPFKNDFEKSF